jgi:serine/threonine-protein kinase
MGVVYKAIDLKLDRTVALKFLPADLGAGETEKERFLREAKTASSLDHTNIGVIHGIEETADGRLFIVMAYYEGETLAQKIRRGPLGTVEALDLAIQIARGLAEAHSRNIIHRDVKPSNVIVTQKGVAKIVDFGLARIVETTSATHSVGISGTVGYMSPEQALSKPLDQRTDLWALGVTLAEMLGARNPFQRESAGATMLAILHQPPAGFENQPPELQAILYRAMAKDPENRYESAGEMLGDLERVRNALAAPVEAPDAGAPTLSLGTRRSRRSRELEKYLVQATGSHEIFGPAPKRRWKRWAAAAAAVVALAAASLLVPAVRSRVDNALLGAPVYHVAVLPFQTIGGGASDKLVAEGLVQSLTGKLSNLDVGKKSLWVVPASVVLARKVTGPTAALRDLGATVVVQGSIERQGQDVQLTVNLIDTKTLRQIGSAQFEDPTGDLSMLQDEAVSRLANLMGITMTPAMLKATGGRVQPLAYESYLKALGYLQRYDKPGNIAAAIAALQSATNADPQFALGYAELGEAYRLRYQVDRNPQWIGEAKANCNQALHLDAQLPAAYVTLGQLHATLGKYDLAQQEFQQALSLDPHDASAEMGLANNYQQAGRTAAAEAAFKRAIALQPGNWNAYNSLANFYADQGENTQAIGEYQKALRLTPDNPQLYSNMASVYLDMGTPAAFSEAETALKKSLALAPSYPAYANLGFLYMQVKRYAESASMTEKALAIDNHDFRVWANLVLAYEWLHENRKAAAARARELTRLEAAAKQRPQDATLESGLATLYAEQGQRGKALSRLQSALALAPHSSQVLADAGETYEALGDRGKALRYVEQALRRGYSLDSLKTNPEFQALLKDPNFRPDGK